MNYTHFSSESVCAGHPDKICDQISDAVVDTAIKIYNKSRVACETLVTANKIVMAGEVACPQALDYQALAKKVVFDLGYTDSVLNFGPKSSIDVSIHSQSGDIALGVDGGGAGDQGMMFGYACNETSQYMPLPICIAHDLCREMDSLATTSMSYLRPDGKSEVTVRYENGRPVEVERVVLAKPFDHDAYDKEVVKVELFKLVVLPVLEKYKMNKLTIDNVILNGTGKWNVGGPFSDTGVTGRKIVVDTYGGMGRIGGGCFSGKDPTKVDRSAAYAARFIAKNIVASGLATRCEVQLAYAIGYKDPICKSIDTFGTSKASDMAIADFAWRLLDLSVEGILTGLDLRQPIYQKTASYGHFGNPDFSWEKLVSKN